MAWPQQLQPRQQACERDHGADERIAPSLDVCDVAIAKLAVTKCLADRGHVDPEASLLHGHVRPNVIDEVLLCDHLTRTLGKVDQDVERPAAKGQHHTLAPKRPLPARKLEGAKLQISLNMIVSQGSWPGVCLSGMFNYPCETQACVPDRQGCVPDRHEPASALCGELCPKGSARGDRRRDACSHDAGRFPLAYRGRTLRHCLHPPNGGRNDVDRGSP